MTRKWKTGIILCATLLLLAACSSTRVGYSFLDNLIRWELNEYVSLYGKQSRDIDAALDTFHAWHRTEQLPVYTVFLAQQIAVLQRPTINSAQLQQAYTRALSLWAVSARKLAPDLAQLLSTLDTEQLQQLQKNMDAKNREYERERILPSLTKRRDSRRERMLESLEKWIGTPTEEQVTLVEHWLSELSFDTAARLEQRKLMRQRFDQLLLLREQPEQMQQQLTRLIATPEQNWTPAYRQYLQLNRQKTYQLLIALHASLSPPQKQKLLGKLAKYQQDFSQLIQP